MLVGPNAQRLIVLGQAGAPQRRARRVLHKGQTIVVKLVVGQQHTLVAIVARHVQGDLLFLDRVQLPDVLVPGGTFAQQIRGECDLLDRWVIRVFGVLVAIEYDRRSGLGYTALTVGTGATDQRRRQGGGVLQQQLGADRSKHVALWWWWCIRSTSCRGLPTTSRLA